jgi:hypothetical protein
LFLFALYCFVLFCLFVFLLGGGSFIFDKLSINSA